MRKVLFLALGILMIFMGNTFAQVIADFEAGTDGFVVGWGDGLSLAQGTDPAGLSSGTLANTVDVDNGGGAMYKGSLDASGAKFATFYVYLPAGIPDSIMLKVFAQDQSWSWKDDKYYTVDIPKEKWYPLKANFEIWNIQDAGFDLAEGTLQRLGIEFSVGEVTGDDTTWTGDILVDNISLIGVEPQIVADFEAGTDGFVVGWGDGLSLAQGTDPLGLSSGTLANTVDVDNGGGAMYKGSVEAEGFQNGCFYVYLPAGIPDSIMLKVFAQDQSWTWKDDKYYTVNIPKEEWYPVSADFAKWNAQDAGFDLTEGALQRFGIEFSVGEVTGDDTTWTGDILVDNACLLGTETGKKWVVCDFENEVGGTQGFANNGWGAALSTVEWLADPTAESDGVMNTVWDFDGVDPAKGSLQKGNITFGWTETDTGATSLSFDVYVPEDIPPAGSQLGIFVVDPSWTWTEQTISISDSTVVPGQWNTIYYDIVHYTELGNIDPTQAMIVGIQIYYGVANSWAGNIYFDNFTLYGIEAPEQETVSPTVTSEIDTAEAFPDFYYVQLNWADSGPGTESYSVYMSSNEITDIEAEGVIRIADQIPHGEEYWVHRPWTSDGSEQTYYYAVLAQKPTGELTDLTGGCKVGPVTVTTNPTAKATYVANFSSTFSLDGLDTEFESYKNNQLTPENAGGDSSEVTGWTPESTDMSWAMTFVIDDDYLYISADVTDDDLNAEGNEPKYSGTQPWMGDALEFFFGAYNVNLLDDWKAYDGVNKAGTGDYRIAFTAWGTTGTATNNDYHFPGVEPTVYQKFTGDGYIIEARVALDSLAGEDLEVVNGACFPMQINGNDLDPTVGPDSGRTLQANWGGQSGHEVWKRSSAWGFLEVVGGTAVDDDTQEPRTYSLHNNYPNPFNPSTTIKFEMADFTDVTIEIYDILGNKINTLFKGKKAAGSHEIVWNGKNSAGVAVSSGLYFYKMKTKSFTKTKKMMLLK